MDGATVHILEDNASTRGALTRGLTEESYQVESFASGAALLARLQSSVPDVLIIDIGLPEADGRDVCSAVRARGLQTPILFLTARGPESAVSAFAAGGDDYVTKPFEFDELVARLAALVRRSGTSAAEPHTTGLRLDPTEFTVSSDGHCISLSATEFRLLACLFASRGSLVRRRDLFRAAWPLGGIVQQNTLDVFMARVRRKLTELPEPCLITTVRGVGYRLS